MNTENNKKAASRFGFTTKRPVAIFMIVLGIAVFGMVSYKTLTWDLMPEISYPSFTIRTAYPGAAPEEVENVVSRRLEEQLSLIKDLRSITSVSRPEQSDIILEFAWNTNLDRAAQEIREKIDQVFLDRDVERPMILRYDPKLEPVLRIAVVSDIPLMQLREYVEDEIARDLESLDGVAAAQVKGGLEKEILVKLDEKQLAATRIHFSQVTSRLAQENINLAGGNIKEGDTEYIVRTLNQFKTVKEIGEIIIARKENVLVRLKDIADILYSHKERTVITRIDGKESVEIDIKKEADANIVEVCNRVLRRLLGTPEQQAFVKALQERDPKEKKSAGQLLREKRMTDFLAFHMPSGVDYKILSNQSIFIESSINEVKNTAIIGGILAIIVLYLFLHHFGTTIIVAVSIPLSIIATFAPLSLFNVSLNIMSLGGLALGIGMLVDNSIVVMESIFRCREEGDGWVDSAVRGASEVGGAVVASTLTTIAVFFPIVFVEGIAGQIFGHLSLAVVFSLLASLMVSLFFIPMLASRKFEFKRDSPAKRFSYPIEEKRTFGNYLGTPWVMVKHLVVILRNFIVFGFIVFLCIFTVLLYPLLWVVQLKEPLLKLISGLVEITSEWKLLWDNFMEPAPFTQFNASLAKWKNWYPRIPAYIYYTVRFIIQAGFLYFTRLTFTFLALLIVTAKGLGIILLALVLPVIHFITGNFNKIMDRLNFYYPRILSSCLKNDGGVIAVILALFALSIFVVAPQLGSELIPEVHQGSLHVNINLPVGTPVENTDALLQGISKKISALPLVSEVGYFAGTTKDELSEKEVGEHIGKITLNISKEGNVKENELSVMRGIRGLLKGFTDMDYNIESPVLFTMKPPIEVVLKAYNLELLRKVAGDVFKKLSQVEGLKDIQNSVRPGFPELVITFQRMKLSYYGLNAFDVASLIKNKIDGFVATKFKEKDRRVDIRVYLKDDQRRRAENIKNLIINPGGAVPIRLSSVADVNIVSGPNEIRRVDQDRSAVISANISGIDLKSAVAKIHTIINAYPMPPGFNYVVSGQSKEMETSLNSLIMALLLAIFLVYIVMASQFESFLHPFMILFTIPMALIGVLCVLYVFNIPLSVFVYIGMITLVGIVVNNAIVLIDYINVLRKRGVEKMEAIKQAGKIRMRPILITTSTTVLGLLPMAMGMGEGSEIRTPMAISVIAGLLSATFLTLVLIPIVYNRFSK